MSTRDEKRAAAIKTLVEAAVMARDVLALGTVSGSLQALQQSSLLRGWRACLFDLRGIIGRLLLRCINGSGCVTGFKLKAVEARDCRILFG